MNVLSALYKEWRDVFSAGSSVGELICIFLISNCICPNFKIYLSKFQNIFVQISKCFVQIALYEGARLFCECGCASELNCDNLLHCTCILHPMADLGEVSHFFPAKLFVPACPVSQKLLIFEFERKKNELGGLVGVELS